MIVRFIVEDDIKSLNVSLEEASNALLYWLKNNRLTSNPDKCHTLISTKILILVITHEVTASVKKY